MKSELRIEVQCLRGLLGNADAVLVVERQRRLVVYVVDDDDHVDGRGVTLVVGLVRYEGHWEYFALQRVPVYRRHVERCAASSAVYCVDSEEFLVFCKSGQVND